MTTGTKTLESLLVPKIERVYSLPAHVEVYSYSDGDPTRTYVISVYYSLDMAKLRLGVEEAVKQVSAAISGEKTVRYICISLISAGFTAAGPSAFAALGKSVRTLRTYLHEGKIEGRIVLVNFRSYEAAFAEMLEKAFLRERISVAADNWPGALATYSI